MKANPLRAGVARGELQIGTWVNMMRNPASMTMFKQAGLDFVRIDMEHSSPSIETVADFAAMGRALDFPVMVRPPEANREWITRLLDIGIYNIHCPQVDTPQHAAEIVAASRYTPRGSRGMSGGSPGNDFDTSMPMMERLNINEMIMRPLFNTMSFVAVLILMPMLTMRVFSEEKKTGTIELILTSPVKDWHVILGKFFGFPLGSRTATGRHKHHSGQHTIACSEAADLFHASRWV